MFFFALASGYSITKDGAVERHRHDAAHQAAVMAEWNDGVLVGNPSSFNKASHQ